MSEHTPTPWRVAEDGAIRANCNEWIADTYHPRRITNAKFIVRAVNNFDDLVAALKEAIAELNEWCEEESGEGYNNPRFNEILARAEGQS
jgi:hypothetical protein